MLARKAFAALFWQSPGCLTNWIRLTLTYPVQPVTGSHDGPHSSVRRSVAGSGLHYMHYNGGLIDRASEADVSPVIARGTPTRPLPGQL